MASQLRRELSSARFLVGFGITGALLWLAARAVDWERALTAIWRVDLRWAGLALIALVGSYATFALRWRVLLAGRVQLPYRTAFSYLMIGALASTVLPLRLGDVARAVLLGRRCGASPALVGGSIIVERILDVATLLIFLALLTPVIEIPAAIRAGVGALAVAAALAGAGLLLIAEATRGAVAKTLARWARAFPGGSYLLTILRRLSTGAAAVRDPARLATSALLSVVSWSLVGAATAAYVSAFQLATPWYAGFFVMVAVNLGSAIPSSPGSVGVYHYLAMLALSFWVVDSNAAFGYALGTHALSIALIGMLGGIALAREGISLRWVRSISAAGDSPPPGTPIGVVGARGVETERSRAHPRVPQPGDPAPVSGTPPPGL